MNTLLALAAGIEVVTGLALIVDPSIVARLLFGGDLSGPGQALGTLGGFALFALALACWPTRDAAGSTARALRAMLLFSLLAALYLVYLGVGGGAAGPLLWPAAALHAVLTLLLGRVWLRLRGASRPSET